MSQSQYQVLTPELNRRMEEENRDRTYTDFSFHDEGAIRRIKGPMRETIWRPPFARDIDKIIYCPYYSRYADKTQVFSFYKNDDITRRSLHVQMVSRIARTIGRSLHLNLDLIEAIGLGHDIGHPPFAHTGEKYLDELYCAHTGRHFYHSIHSARVLDKILPYNLTLQTLNGIAAHNGEIELEAYCPKPLKNFEEYDEIIEACYRDKAATKLLVPDTLEAAVMRISDIIAYLGTDRVDAMRMKLVRQEDFTPTILGTLNKEIINNLVVNIIENSYGKPYIKMDTAHFDALKQAKRENYALIYENGETRPQLQSTVKPMMAELYEKLLADLLAGDTESPIFRHHILYVKRYTTYHLTPYEETEPNQLVVDYLASMTDDYLIDLHRNLFPDSPYRVEYRGYFRNKQEDN